MLITFDQKEYQKLNDKSYQLEKRRLQIELLKLQEDVIKNNRRLCIIFEGRDTAERWKKVIPKKGEIAFLDRSWYTRALTEPVMGYCTEKQYIDFMEKVIPWEEKLIYEGVEIIKFYFSLSKDQQKRRMKARKKSELKYWKLSPNDERIVTKWDAFTLYKEQMFERTSPSFSPWIAINANNKMIARLTALRFILNQVPYENKKLLKPLAWTKKINNYKATLEGIEFDNLSFEQYKILTKYSDD